VIEVRLAPAEHYGWIAKKIGLRPSSEFRALEAVDGNEIVGMVGYDSWTPNACSMHVAIERPIAVRRLIRPAFGLVFDPRPRGAGLGVVFGTVMSNNEKALAFDRSLGFREVTRLRDAWEVGVDMVLLEMRRDACRWLGG
jgi:RimJ/RimL family protein N-acetyltransferase